MLPATASSSAHTCVSACRYTACACAFASHVCMMLRMKTTFAHIITLHEDVVCVTHAQGYISTLHMRWFLEAEGSRNYEDEETMNALMRKLDTNGDGQVKQATCCLAISSPLLFQLSVYGIA